MAVSIKDVAAQAGVSTATVSHVLNETRKISPATRKRVLDAVDSLGYAINRAARNLAMGRGSGLLGALISDLRNPFFPEAVAPFQEEAVLHQFETLVLNTDYDPVRMVDCVRRLIGLQVAGVAVFTSQIDPAVVEMLAARNVPTVYLDLGRTAKHIAEINIDYERGIAEGVEHLHQLGHRAIGYMGGPVHLGSAQRRKRAFIESAARLGLEPVAMTDSDFSVKGGFDSCRKIFQRAKPTALMSANDMTAIGAMHAAHELRLEVPRDLSLVGFDDIEFAQYTQPALTTVALPRDEIGRLAYQALDGMWKHPEKSGAAYRVSTRLSLRESTAPPPPK